MGDTVHLESTGDFLWWYGVPGYDSIYAKEIVLTPDQSLRIYSRSNATHVGNGIFNGDFSLGDTFFQSEMRKTQGCDPESRRVCTWNNFCLPNANIAVDFTTGLSGVDSQFISFYFNKSIDPGTNVLYSQSVRVEPYGVYTLSYWFRNLAEGMGFVRVTINGQEIQKHPVSVNNHPANDAWYKYAATWNATDTTIALVEFRLVDDGCFWDLAYPCGSLFGLDGLELIGDYYCRDEISITVSHPPLKPVIQFINDTLFVSPDSTVDYYEWFCEDSLLTAFIGAYCRPTIQGDYRVKAVSGTCESNSELYPFVNLSEEEIHSHHSILIYPQPAKSLLWVKLNEEGQSIKTIRLYDLHGRFLKQLLANQPQDVSFLDPGLYIIEIHDTDHGVAYHKIVIE